MLRIFLAIVLLCGGARANELPPFPANAVLLSAVPCTDNETGEQGECALLDSDEGKFIVFSQGGEVMFIRKIYDDKPYEQIYTADRYNSF